MTNRMFFCLTALRTCGTLSETVLRKRLGVHPLTLRALSRRGMIRPGSLRSPLKTWEVTP